MSYDFSQYENWTKVTSDSGAVWYVVPGSNLLYSPSISAVVGRPYMIQDPRPAEKKQKDAEKKQDDAAKQAEQNQLINIGASTAGTVGGVAAVNGLTGAGGAGAAGAAGAGTGAAATGAGTGAGAAGAGTGAATGGTGAAGVGAAGAGEGGAAGGGGAAAGTASTTFGGAAAGAGAAAMGGVFANRMYEDFGKEWLKKKKVNQRNSIDAGFMGAFPYIAVWANPALKAMTGKTLGGLIAGNNRTTKQYEYDRRKALIDKGQTGLAQFDVTSENEQGRVVRDPNVGHTAYDDVSVLGNYETYGDDWDKLSLEQKAKVAQLNNDQGLYWDNKGDRVIKDEDKEKAKQNLDAVVSGKAQVDPGANPYSVDPNWKPKKEDETFSGTAAGAAGG